MDFNETLKQIRALVRIYFNGGKWNEPEATELAELIDALDCWISRGGFLPESWSNNASSLNGQPMTDDLRTRILHTLINNT